MAGIGIIEELGESFVKKSVDQTASVAMDIDAFAMIVEETESLFRVLGGEVQSLNRMVTGRKPDDPSQRSIVEAVQKLFREVHLQKGGRPLQRPTFKTYVLQFGSSGRAEAIFFSVILMGWGVGQLPSGP